VTSAKSLAGPPRLAANAAGAAVVTWGEAPPGRPAHRPVVYAARRPTISGQFGTPQVAADCGAADASQTYARPSMNAAGTAVVAFQTACGPDLGLGPNLGIAAVTGTLSGNWSAPTPLSSGGYAVGVQVGSADAGGTVVTWTERAFGAPQAVEGLRVAILQ
jgi:hypothetical protein